MHVRPISSPVRLHAICKAGGGAATAHCPRADVCAACATQICHSQNTHHHRDVYSQPRKRKQNSFMVVFYAYGSLAQGLTRPTALSDARRVCYDFQTRPTSLRGVAAVSRRKAEHSMAGPLTVGRHEETYGLIVSSSLSIPCFPTVSHSYRMHDIWYYLKVKCSSLRLYYDNKTLPHPIHTPHATITPCDDLAP